MADHDKPRARIDSLDALRGICALSVAIFHFETTGALSNLAFFRHSWMLVDFFFVLSGFVITAAYADDLRKGYSIPRFLFLRLARIWPLHAVMLLCFLALELSKLVVQVGPAAPLFAPPRELGSLTMNLLLLQVFGLYDHLTWNVPSWSIAAEFWVYIIAAFAFRHVGAGRSGLLAATAILCASAMILRGAPFLNLAHDGAVIRCLYGFCIGALAWAAFTRDTARPVSWITAISSRATFSTILEITVIAAAVMAVSVSDGGALTIAMPPLFGICVLILAQQGGLLSALLSRKLPVWLGSISYSIYMTHSFLEGRLLDLLTIAGRLMGTTFVERSVVDGVGAKVLIGSEWFVDTVMLTLIVLIVALSYATYRFVEQPCNTWARSRIRRMPPTSAAAAA